MIIPYLVEFSKRLLLALLFLLMGLSTYANNNEGRTSLNKGAQYARGNVRKLPAFSFKAFFRKEPKETKQVPLTKSRVIATGYCGEHESDHKKYGNKDAVGKPLRYYSEIRTAASYWPRFPLGTILRVNDHLYKVSDYGSSVGRERLDLYFPNRKSMRAWGKRNIEVEIVKMGCLIQSEKVLRDRVKYSKHVSRMHKEILKKLRGNKNLSRR